MMTSGPRPDPNRQMICVTGRRQFAATFPHWLVEALVHGSREETGTITGIRVPSSTPEAPSYKMEQSATPAGEVFLSSSSTAHAEAAPSTCHFLPCSVDFSGRVPGAALYFQPTPMGIDQEEAKNGKLLAASLRGRGLMGRADTVSGANCPAHLQVFKVDNAEGVLAVDGASINHFVEWQHQHVPESAQNTKGRMKNAQAWLRVAQALHTPLPPPESF